MFNNLIAGNEKAALGGLSAGLTALLGQAGVNGQLTIKEAVYSLVVWVVTHIVVFITLNSEKPGSLLGKVGTTLQETQNFLNSPSSSANTAVNDPTNTDSVGA